MQFDPIRKTTWLPVVIRKGAAVAPGSRARANASLRETDRNANVQAATVDSHRPVKYFYHMRTSVQGCHYNFLPPINPQRN